MEQSNNLIPIIDYFVERQCLPDWRISTSVISFYDLTYVYKGKSTYIVNGKSYSLSDGDFIFIPKGSTREAFTDSISPMHCFAFNFRYTNIDNHTFELVFPSTFHYEDYELLELYKKASAAWLVKLPGYMLQARALFMLILHKLLSKSEKGFDSVEDKRIIIIKEYIVNNYRKKIDIEALSRMVNLSSVYTGHLFKKATGMTIKEYTNLLRIHAAEALLSTGGFSISEACYNCGFEDPFYFSKAFKKLTGRSPSSLLRAGK